MDDVSEWIGVPLEIIRSEKYSDTFAVYRKVKFLKNQYGARSTLELKKNPRRHYENLAADLQVFGYDADEAHRVNRFIGNNSCFCHGYLCRLYENRDTCTTQSI